MTPAQLKLLAQIGVVLGLIALACAALYGVYNHGATATDLRWQAVQADQQNLQSKALAAATTENRTEEQRRQLAANLVGKDAREQNAAAAVDIAAADAAGQRLHNEAAKLAASASCTTGDIGAAQRGASATRAAMVLFKLFKRADQRTGELAIAYDRARIAGLACEAAYDYQVTPSQIDYPL